MPSVTTPAVVLRATAYGETSRIVRLLTRELGLVSGMARGARRARSATGPRLDMFASGTATLFVRGNRDLHPLTAFELERANAALARDVERFAAASALVELALRCAPADAHPEVFAATADGLAAVADSTADVAPTAALMACWGLVVALGYAPATDSCAVCARRLEDAASFSAHQGGTVCRAHREPGRETVLRAGDRAALAALASGRLPDVPLDRRHAAAHRRLLHSFIRHHLAENRALPALAFWEGGSWTTAT